MPVDDTWDGSEMIAIVSINHVRFGHHHLIHVRYGVPEPGSYASATHATPVTPVAKPYALDALCTAASRVPVGQAVLTAAAVVATTGPLAIPMTVLADTTLVTGAMVVDVAGMALRVGQRGADLTLTTGVYATFGSDGHQVLTLRREWSAGLRNAVAHEDQTIFLGRGRGGCVTEPHVLHGGTAYHFRVMSCPPVGLFFESDFLAGQLGLAYADPGRFSSHGGDPAVTRRGQSVRREARTET